MADIYDGSTTFIYFDIETIPCMDATYLDELRANIKPPGNLKKPESIAKWLDENREEKAIEAMAKTSFDAGRGHVCTISMARNNNAISTNHAETIGDEVAAIEAFFDFLDPHHSEVLVGHNINGFDIPFLTKRAVALGIKLPPNSSFPRDPKPWAKGVHDTMTMWAGSRDRISMDNLCKILGIPGKGGLDGSQVAAAWANGEHDKIAEYCADDVDRTRQIHQRFLKAGW